MARRSAVTPDVPTVSETVAPGFDMAASIGVFATGGTSREIIARLSQALNAALRSPDVLERMAPIGMEPVGTTPEEYASRLRRDYERYGELVKQIGMRID
jgi:tripartite-type tricarboxylate transporter receptor subunit TctC